MRSIRTVISKRNSVMPGLVQPCAGHPHLTFLVRRNRKTWMAGLNIKPCHDERESGVGMNAWDDPRIARGMEKQLATRRARIAAGEKPIGWKVGLGAPAAMERLRIKAPLVGFMMEKSLLANGVTVSLASWTKPVAEPEVAVHMGKDLPGDTDRAAAIAAIAGIGPAIELADLNPPPDDVEAMLARNIS